MARQQPVAAEGVREHVLPDQTTSSGQEFSGPEFSGQEFSGQGLPQQERRQQPVQRIAGVRIIRGGVWSGLSLRLAVGVETASLIPNDLMELSLVMQDGRSVRIATVEGDEAVAIWRGASNASGLPMMIETADGAVQAPFPQIGRLALGPIRIRRSHGVTATRRPRFLRRRKTAKLADMPMIVNGEVLSDR